MWISVPGANGASQSWWSVQPSYSAHGNTAQCDKCCHRRPGYLASDVDANCRSSLWCHRWTTVPLTLAVQRWLQWQHYPVPLSCTNILVAERAISHPPARSLPSAEREGERGGEGERGKERGVETDKSNKMKHAAWWTRTVGYISTDRRSSRTWFGPQEIWD